MGELDYRLLPALALGADNIDDDIMKENHESQLKIYLRMVV